VARHTQFNNLSAKPVWASQCGKQHIRVEDNLHEIFLKTSSSDSGASSPNASSTDFRAARNRRMANARLSKSTAISSGPWFASRLSCASAAATSLGRLRINVFIYGDYTPFERQERLFPPHSQSTSMQRIYIRLFFASRKQVLIVRHRFPVASDTYGSVVYLFSSTSSST
jgi:hypothetical protein